MSSKTINFSHFSPDIQEFIQLLYKYKVRYVIAGGEAVIYYGYARLTGDVDFFYDLNSKNVLQLYGALNEFWNGDIPGIENESELHVSGQIIQFGRPPNRIDLLNAIDGVEFEDVWETKETVTLVFPENELPIYLIGLDKLIENKAASGRAKDLEDLVYLRQAARSKK